MVPTTTGAWDTLVEIQGSRSPFWNPRTTTRCTVPCMTACIGSSRSKHRRSGRHRSVANAELWSNTLTRCSRHQHSVSLLQLSELDFWENTCAGNCSECSKQSLRVFQTQKDSFRKEIVVVSCVQNLHQRPLLSLNHRQKRMVEILREERVSEARVSLGS